MPRDASQKFGNPATSILQHILPAKTNQSPFYLSNSKVCCKFFDALKTLNALDPQDHPMPTQLNLETTDTAKYDPRLGETR